MFEIKDKLKKNNVDLRSTLDSHHYDKIKHFENTQNQIPLLEKKKTLEKEIKQLKVKLKNLNDLDKELEMSLSISLLENNIIEIDNEINKIKSNKDEIKYYLETSSILETYYDF